MTDTAKRWGPQSLTGSSATVGAAVPASTTMIMRSIHIANVGASRRTCKLSIGTDAVGTRWLGDIGLDPGQTYDWTGFMPLLTTETLKGQADVTNELTITVGGIEIT